MKLLELKGKYLTTIYYQNLFTELALFDICRPQSVNCDNNKIIDAGVEVARFFKENSIAPYNDALVTYPQRRLQVWDAGEDESDSIDR